MVLRAKRWRKITVEINVYSSVSKINKTSWNSCDDNLCSTAQIWLQLAEIERTSYFLRFSTIKKVSSHAQIWPQGAEKQIRKVRVGGGGGWVHRSKTKTAPAPRWARSEQSASSWSRACQYTDINISSSDLILHEDKLYLDFDLHCISTYSIQIVS